jgi:hypothetical protein
MARTKPKLPTAARRNINDTSGIVEEGRSSPDCLDENALSSNVSSSSRDRSFSPGEVFTYHGDDKVMSRKGTENKYDAPFSGPHKILKVNTNGTVRLRVGSVTDTVNIRRIEPYKEVSDSIHGVECNMRLSKKRRRAHD